jgi:hypothetical protein
MSSISGVKLWLVTTANLHTMLLMIPRLMNLYISSRRPGTRLPESLFTSVYLFRNWALGPNRIMIWPKRLSEAHTTPIWSCAAAILCAFIHSARSDMPGSPLFTSPSLPSTAKSRPSSCLGCLGCCATAATYFPLKDGCLVRVDSAPVGNGCSLQGKIVCGFDVSWTRKSCWWSEVVKLLKFGLTSGLVGTRDTST